jgi:glutathione S-transferase
MKLFHTPGTCSLAPIIVAEWLDIKLDLRKVDLQNLDSYFLSLNPLGQVPVLEMNSGECKNQVDAILQYFCALNPEGKLVGKDIFDWFEIDRWIAFLTGDFNPAFAAWFNPGRYTTEEDEASLEAVKAAAENRIHRVTRVLENQVGSTEHIVLGRRTLVDAYGYALVRWLELLDGGFDQYPNLKQFMDRMNDDYHVQKALLRETNG